MACASAPPSVAAATLTYNTTHATYTCASGYSLQGNSEVLCNAGSWDSTPQCILLYQNPDVDNYVTVNGADVPTWLAILFGVVAGICALLLLTCLIMCCLHVFGCASGPFVSYGGHHMYEDDGERVICCCCRNPRRRRRRPSYDSECANYVNSSRRQKPQTEAKIAGFNYVKPKPEQKTQYVHVDEAKSTKSMKTASSPDSGVEFARNDDMRFSNTVTELIAQEKRNKPAKELQKWMPHSHNVRNINTSTK